MRPVGSRGVDRSGFPAKGPGGGGEKGGGMDALPLYPG